MKLGLISDIHEYTDALAAALGYFRRAEVDQVVVLGDVFEMGQWIDKTCRLLAEAKTIGVWGNHDFGVCVEPDERTREKYPPHVIDYMTSLQGRLTLGDCHFTHVEPWLDPHVLDDLWYFEGVPHEPAQLARIFNARPERVLFAGHFHQWLLATPEGVQPWNGETEVRLDRGRYFVVIAALRDGYFATYDTASCVLTPLSVD